MRCGLSAVALAMWRRRGRSDRSTAGRSRLIAPLQSRTAQGAFAHCAPCARIDRSARRRRRQPLVDELLHPIALGLAGDEIAARIDPEAVQVVELARLAPGSADLADLLERSAVENGDALVGAVGDVEE